MSLYHPPTPLFVEKNFPRSWGQCYGLLQNSTRSHKRTTGPLSIYITARYQSLCWTSELWLSVGLSQLWCWRSSYAQNAGGILTESLGRLRFLVWVKISRRSHMTTGPVCVRLAVGLENHTACYVSYQSVSCFLSLPHSRCEAHFSTESCFVFFFFSLVPSQLTVIRKKKQKQNLHS